MAAPAVAAIAATRITVSSRANRPGRQLGSSYAPADSSSSLINPCSV